VNNDNPTEDYENPTEHDGTILRDIDIEKEQFLRGFLTRQREFHRKSLAMVANLAQANIELILTTGINEVAAKRTHTATKDIVNDAASSLLTQRIKREAANSILMQRTKREATAETAINNLKQVLAKNVE